MQADRLIRRQCPGRGGPDRNRCVREIAARELEAARGVERVNYPEPHVHRWRRALLVLDLRLRERRAAVQAPVHGLEAADQVAPADDRGKGAQLLCLIARCHREIRIVPVADDPETLEIHALRFHLARSELPAGLAEGVGIELLAHASMFLLDLLLDWQAMAVPARHVRRVVAVERARLDDDVLEDLVDRVADVDHAVGIGRAVQQHELRAPRELLALLSVDVVALPGFHEIRLATREIRLHREVGVRQVDRLLVVHESFLRHPEALALAARRGASVPSLIRDPGSGSRRAVSK